MKIRPYAIVGMVAAMFISSQTVYASSRIAVKPDMMLPETPVAVSAKAYDGDLKTAVCDNKCHHTGIGVKFSEASEVAAVRFYAKDGDAGLVNSAKVQVADDGKKWTTILNFAVYCRMPSNTWIYATLPYAARFKYFRLVGVPKGQLAELEWYAKDDGFKKGDFRPLPVQYQNSEAVDFNKMPLTVLAPEYRGMVSVARRQSAIKFRYLLNTALGAVAGIKVKTSICNEKGDKISSFEFKTEFGSPSYIDVPMRADAEPGRYMLRVSYKVGGVNYNSEIPFKIVPVRPKQFFVDQDGVILKEGKPFFPLGIHHAHGFQIDEWIDMGMNMIQMWSWDWMHNYSTNSAYWYIQPTNDAHYAQQLASNLRNIRLLEERDIYAIYEDGRVWNELILQLMGRFGTKANEWRKGIYPFETNETFRATIESAVKDPLSRVGMWYLADEAGGDSWVPKLQRAGKYFHDLDEDHPTFNLSAGDHSIAAGGDVYSFDCYPRYYGGTGVLTRISNTMYDAYKQVGKTKAVIVVPQAFGQSEKQPTEDPKHVRAMSYLAIVRGARGMFWYCWKQTGDWAGKQKQGMGWNPPTAKMVKTLIAEFKVFGQALLEPNPEFLTSDDGLVLGIVAGSEKTGRFLIYVNGDLEKRSNSAIKVPLKDGTELEPLFGGPQGAVKDGKIALDLPALATGVFKIK